MLAEGRELDVVKKWVASVKGTGLGKKYVVGYLYFAQDILHDNSDYLVLAKERSKIMALFGKKYKTVTAWHSKDINYALKGGVDGTGIFLGFEKWNVDFDFYDKKTCDEFYARLFSINPSIEKRN